MKRKLSSRNLVLVRVCFRCGITTIFYFTVDRLHNLLSTVSTIDYTLKSNPLTDFAKKIIVWYTFCKGQTKNVKINFKPFLFQMSTV